MLKLVDISVQLESKGVGICRSITGFRSENDSRLSQTWTNFLLSQQFEGQMHGDLTQLYARDRSFTPTPTPLY